MTTIIDNGDSYTVTLSNEGYTTYVFAKASSAVRFEIMTTAKVTVAENETTTVRFRVNPSTAWVPTGATSADPASAMSNWELDAIETRAGYVDASPNFSLIRIEPSGAGEGEYVATIRCDDAETEIDDYVLALVLNTGSVSAPVLVSSGPFVLGAEEGEPVVPAESANCFIVPPGGSVAINMDQILTAMDSYDFVVSMDEDDDVTVEPLWATSAEVLNGLHIKMLTPEDSGFLTLFSVAVGAAEGSAVVAAKVDGEVVWSWHIWITGYEPAGEGLHYHASGGTTSETTPDAGQALVFMDRNLGALNATPDDLGAMGMLYQWGRKDPFPSHWQSWPFFAPNSDEPTIYTPAAPEGTTTAVVNIPVSEASGAEYATAHPLTFIYNNRASEPAPGPYSERSWYAPTGGAPRYFWHDVYGTGAETKVAKSAYDPCPAGWRVPAEGSHTILMGGSNSMESPFGVTMDAGPYFPYTGMRRQDRGEPQMGFVTVCWFGQSYFDHDAYNLHSAPPNNAPVYQADAMPVRCVQIQAG